MFFFRSSRPFLSLAYRMEALLHGRLWLQAILALLLGIGTGLLLGPDFDVVSPERAAFITAWLALPGELFLRLIKMILIPLLAASIIRGLGGAKDPAALKRLGFLFFPYVICTSIVAATIGMVLAWYVQPGSFIKTIVADQAATGSIPLTHAGVDGAMMTNLPLTLVELIPANPLASAVTGELLGIVIFSIIIGLAFGLQKNAKMEPFLSLIDALLEISMTIIQWAMWLVPLAVFGLIARMAAQSGLQTILGMGVYVGTVLVGLFLLLIFYLLLAAIFGRFSPLRFLRSIFGVQLVAFSTSSSAAVMPYSMKVAEESLDVEPESAKVIIPLGATINMDGTALYQSIAILFLAQTAGMQLTFPQMILIVFTLVLSSIGAPATPGVGMVVLTSIAANFGIPSAGSALILGVDRILDMSRTAVNVTGDLTACVLFGRKKQKDGAFLAS